jgi:hypothetical protein
MAIYDVVAVGGVNAPACPGHLSSRVRDSLPHSTTTNGFSGA